MHAHKKIRFTSLGHQIFRPTHIYKYACAHAHTHTCMYILYTHVLTSVHSSVHSVKYIDRGHTSHSLCPLWVNPKWKTCSSCGNHSKRKPPAGGGFFWSTCIYVNIHACMRNACTYLHNIPNQLARSSSIQTRTHVQICMCVHTHTYMHCTHIHTRTAAHCNTLQHAATHCNNLQLNEFDSRDQDRLSSWTIYMSHEQYARITNSMPHCCHLLTWIDKAKAIVGKCQQSDIQFVTHTYGSWPIHSPWVVNRLDKYYRR